MNEKRIGQIFHIPGYYGTTWHLCETEQDIIALMEDEA